MQNSISSVLKWSMAGWCFFIELMVFIAFLYIVEEEPLPQLSNIFTSTPITTTNIIAIISLMGVPLGYLFYQIYYFFYWTIPVNVAHPPDIAFLNSMVKNCTYGPKSKQSDLNDAYEKWKEYINKSGLVKIFEKAINIISSGNRTVDNVIDFRKSWSTVRAIWLNALISIETDNNVSTANVSSRFEFQTSMHDGLGSVQFANWMAGISSIICWLWVLKCSLICQCQIIIVIFSVVIIGIVVWKFRHSKFDSSRLVSVYIWFASVIIIIGIILFSNSTFAKVIAKHVLFPIVTIGIVSILNRIIWVNRIYLRLSALMLIDNFLCKMNCPKYNCGQKTIIKQRRKGV